MLKKFYLFKESVKNNPTIQKLVDDINKLLNSLHTKYGKGKEAFLLSNDNQLYYLYSVVYKKGLLTLKLSGCPYNKDIKTHIFDEHSDEYLISILKDYLNGLNKIEKNRKKYHSSSLNDRLIFNDTIIKNLVDELNKLLKEHILRYGKNEDSFLVSFSKKYSFIDKNYNIYYLYSVVYKNKEVTVKSSKNAYNENIKLSILNNLDLNNTTSNLKYWIDLLKENQSSRLRHDNLLDLYNKNIKIYVDEIKELNDEIDVLLNCLYDKNGRLIWVFNNSSFNNDDTIDRIDRHYNKYNKKEQFERRINKLKKRISLYRNAIQKKGITPLTLDDYNNLSKFMKELSNLLNTTNYINLETTKNNHYTYFVEDNLDENLKKYNTIPGVYMEQTGNYIKIHLSLTKAYFIIHEQYLPKIYKLFQRIKN